MKRKIILVTILYLIGTLGGLYYTKNIILFFTFLCGIVMWSIKKGKLKNTIIYAVITLIAFFRAYSFCNYVANIHIKEDINIAGNIVRITEKTGVTAVELDVKFINRQTTATKYEGTCVL